MSDRNVTTVERLARQICKLLPLGGKTERKEIRARLLPPAGDRYRVSAKWRRKAQPQEDDFDKAIDLAASSGWLLKQGETVSLTQAGDAIGRRSRVGSRRMRRTVAP